MTTFTINADAPVLVEFAPQPGVRGVSLKPEDIIGKSAQALDSAMNTIHHMARRVTTTIKDLAERPTEVEVMFGLKLDVEAGAIIAKTGGEASLNVKLKWELKKEEPTKIAQP
jgi:hypothetical protein